MMIRPTGDGDRCSCGQAEKEREPDNDPGALPHIGTVEGDRLVSKAPDPCSGGCEADLGQRAGMSPEREPDQH
jgi:hypothetical protein